MFQFVAHVCSFAIRVRRHQHMVALPYGPHDSERLCNPQRLKVGGCVAVIDPYRSANACAHRQTSHLFQILSFSLSCMTTGTQTTD
jgi:hypothetical protein